MGLDEEGDHAEEARVREDADAEAGLLADVDLALGDLVAGRQDGGDADPGRQQQARVPRRPRQVHDPRRRVREDAAEREEPHNGRLRRVVDQPPRHQAVREEVGEVRRGPALWGKDVVSGIHNKLQLRNFIDRPSSGRVLFVVTHSFTRRLLQSRKGGGASSRTQTIASSVSVSRKELSARKSLLSSPDGAVLGPSDKMNSVKRNRRAHRMPHHKAGTIDSRRATMRKGCQRLGTPRATARRGCSREWSKPAGSAVLDWSVLPLLFGGAGGLAIKRRAYSDILTGTVLKIQ